MTPETLAAWMTRLGYNKSEAASALGIARTTLDRYLAGEVKIPKYIKLACDALETQEKFVVVPPDIMENESKLLSFAYDWAVQQNAKAKS